MDDRERRDGEPSDGPVPGLMRTEPSELRRRRLRAAAAARLHLPDVCHRAVIRTAHGCAIAVAVLATSACLRPGNPSIYEETVSPPEPVAVFGAPLPEHAQITLETDAGTIRCDVD